MTINLDKEIAKINTMGTLECTQYRENRIKYSVGEARTILVDACDARLAHLDRGAAMVEFTPLDDFGGH